MQPCPKQLPAQETDGQKLPCTVTNAQFCSGTVEGVFPPNQAETFQSTETPCDMGRDCLPVNDLGLGVVTARPADAAM